MVLESPPPAYDEGRDRGVLTKADREFLLGDKELTDQGERDARYRIRKRIENGILDFALLGPHLSETDRKQVAQSVFSDDDEGNFNLYRLIGLMFQMTLDVENNDPMKATNRFERVLGSEIDHRLKMIQDDEIISVTVSVDPEIRVPDTDNLLEKYRDYEETKDELEFLRDQGIIDVDEEYWRHFLRHQWKEDSILRIVSQGGEPIEIDPKDFDNRDEFMQYGINQIVSPESDSEEGDDSPE